MRNMKTIENLLELAKSDQNHSSVSKSEKIFLDEPEAQRAFAEYKKHLVDLSCWNEAGNLSSYQLFDQNGEIIANGKIAQDLLIRISLKGTGKYDWVKVVEIADESNEMILTVQPTFDPSKKEAKTVSHFFTAEARNNFCLHLDGRKISFYIIGLNEKQNLTQTSDFVEAIRNWVAANVGTYLGLQKAEWTTFAENFITAN